MNKSIKQPAPKWQSPAERWERLTGTNRPQNSGNVFKMKESNQAARLEEQINKELGRY